jgi:hypothetical protein
MSEADCVVNVDRVIVMPDDEHVRLRCPDCSREQLVAMEPTGQFLDTMQAFVEQHAGCNGTTYVHGLPRGRGARR